MSVLDLTDTGVTTPCRDHDPELWFADRPADVARAQHLCGGCALRVACLTGALERREPWGVWGGELFERGAIVARKRPPGRPRKDDRQVEAVAREALRDRLAELDSLAGDDHRHGDLVDAEAGLPGPRRGDGAAA